MKHKTTSKFERMAQAYRHFGRELQNLDWSDEAKQALFNYESRGIGSFARDSENGFFQGKRLMDITVAMWNEDLNAHLRGEPRTLFSWELYIQYPKWLIDMVIPERLRLTEAQIADARESAGHLYPLSLVQPFFQ